ncbi:MAG TPA: ZIP family metal transporter [Candidatus Binataceae bacterium]|jgi:zinc transporter ZupT|nr:ZIP family metal transporter [Candidatus Binataceae bacterium]
MRLVPLMFACLTLISTGLGGLAAIRLRDRLHLLLGFSSGAVLGVALFDILPEIFAMDGGASYMPVVALGFLAFFGLERYTAMHRAREHAHAMAAHEQELGSWNAGGLALHSFLDGVAIGVGFQASFGVGLLIAMGVIAHDLSDGLNTVTVVLAHGNPLRRAVYWLGIDMLTPVLGAAATLLFNLRAGLLPWLLAFFAGSFLYIGASDLLPEAREHDSPLVGVATVVGMLAIFLATRLLRG